MAAPTALATAWCGTCTTSETPARCSGITKQPPPTATRGTGAGRLFHPVVPLLERVADARKRLLDERLREMGHALPIAQIEEAGRHADVRHGEVGPAEDARPLHQPVADAEGSDGERLRG